MLLNYQCQPSRKFLFQLSNVLLLCQEVLNLLTFSPPFLQAFELYTLKINLFKYCSINATNFQQNNPLCLSYQHFLNCWSTAFPVDSVDYINQLSVASNHLLPAAQIPLERHTLLPQTLLLTACGVDVVRNLLETDVYEQSRHCMGSGAWN